MSRRYMFVLHHAIYGGPHNQAAQLAKPLAKRGWETLVVLPTGAHAAAARFRREGVDVVLTPLTRLRASSNPKLALEWARSFRSDVRRLAEIIRTNRVDVVALPGLVNPQPVLAARRAQVPVVWQIVDTRLPIFARRIAMPFVKAWADVVMTTGTRVAQEHPGVIDFGSRWIPYYCPVNFDQFRADPSIRRQARHELGLNADSTVIGNVSNVNPQKGHATFIRAAARLKESRPDVQFVILGATYAHHETYTTNLWKLAESLGLVLGRDLIVRDPGSRVPELEAAFDVFWLTSEPLSEGTPTVLHEAMALEIPVVAVDVGSVRELVNDGVTGRLVKARDDQAICDATVDLLERPYEAKRMATSGAAKVRSLADPEVCADAHLRAFEVALARTRR